MYIFNTFLFFFFNDTATTEIYTLSLQTLFRSWRGGPARCRSPWPRSHRPRGRRRRPGTDRKSTRLNSSHSSISYAVFCLKKKRRNREQDRLAQAIEHKTEVTSETDTTAMTCRI